VGENGSKKAVPIQLTIRQRLALLLGSAESLRGRLIRGGIGSLGVKLVGTLLGLVTSVLLARSLGPDGYGVYAYIFAMISLLAIPSQVGLPSLLVRETAKAHAQGKWGLMRGLWRWSSTVTGVMALVLALLALTIGWFYQEKFSQTQIATFAWGLALVPLVALGNLRGGALRGLRKVVAGQLPEVVLRPGLFVLSLLAVMLLLPEGTLTASTAMALHVMAAALAFLAGAMLLWRARPPQLAAHPLPVYRAREWFGSALPLAFVSGMMLINQQTDILLLGLFRSAEEVGVYRVAVSVATVVAFGLQAITMVVSPHFARLYAQGDLKQLQRVVTQSARLILLLALPVVFLVIVLGERLLSEVFGADYASAYLPLVILALGQLVNSAAGSVAALLNMTGHERDTARGVAIAAGLNMLINVLLIPSFGTLGAAAGTAFSMTVWNVVLWHSVRQRIGIDSMAFKFKAFQKVQ